MTHHIENSQEVQDNLTSKNRKKTITLSFKNVV